MNMEDVFDTSEDEELLAEETYQLALESILRWCVAPDLDWVDRVAAIYKVAGTALDSF